MTIYHDTPEDHIMALQARVAELERLMFEALNDDQDHFSDEYKRALGVSPALETQPRLFTA